MTVCDKLEYVEKYIKTIDTISQDDIKQVAQKYINPTHATISVLMPESYQN